ncbi:thiol-disulfide oxidoreductase DCC family protein [Marinobacterium weihaiense]|uniref:DUF393 domain-containing protein n=1 Tax=Marinobacterium weihaiense TaxID=2851016 RepID=A0ABS6M7M2_9GAMM|nr:DUF393 domain-containing protein [Marinobacterium weihaiense]MBV0931886.1 DUF393 domain-containing protein [Marinobacterium weihaiense]
MPNRPILFYDGQCPLCRKEIAHYRRLDSQQRVDWRDLFDPDLDLAAYGITHEDAMRVIHGVDTQGQLQRGIAAFMPIWDALPGYRHLARMIRILHLQRPLDRIYHWFAKRRYCSRCHDGQCRID